MKKVAVIGAGIGGIAAALHMRAKGFDVDVFEQFDKPGGKLMEFHQDGFRWDMGPSLFTMPEFVTELFDLFRADPKAYFSYHELENTCNYFFPDGSLIKAYSDHAQFAQQLNEVDQQAVSDYLEEAKQLYNSTAGIFLFNPFPSKQAFLSDSGKMIAKNPRILDAFSTLHKRNSKSFKDSRLVQIFDRYATYNGSNPYKTPATLKMIAHLEHNLGAYFPKKGMYQIVSSLTRLAEDQGVNIHLNSRVNQVELLSSGKKRLTFDHTAIEYELLINDVDVYTFYEKMLKNGKVPQSVKLQQRSTSALIFYWGVRQQHAELDVHNILFAKDYKKEFKALFSTKTIHADPTVYIFVSSKIVPDDAPQGMENWFVMINTPENVGQDWDRLVAEARNHIISKIERKFGSGFEDKIVAERIVDPREIESRTGSYRGSLYGTSSNSRFSAFLRHPNKRNKLTGVYFVGGSVHPGGGIPLCLASAKIVANQIENINDQT